MRNSKFCSEIRNMIITSEFVIKFPPDSRLDPIPASADEERISRRTSDTERTDRPRLSIDNKRCPWNPL